MHNIIILYIILYKLYIAYSCRCFLHQVFAGRVFYLKSVQEPPTVARHHYVTTTTTTSFMTSHLVNGRALVSLINSNF